MRRSMRWVFGFIAVLVTGGIMFSIAGASPQRPTTRPLLMGGIEAGPDGRPVTLPVDAPPAAPTAAEREWLARGTVPGNTAETRAMAERALLDMKLLTGPDGAVSASWWTIWKYVWPRDGSWVAAAYTATGHNEEAVRILRHLAAQQRPDGEWEARYTLDGQVPDDRAAQLDGNGWVPWSVWFWFAQQDPKNEEARQTMADLWPTVQKAADRTTALLGKDGLPPKGADYWETRTDQVTLGTAAPLLAGLRSAADLGRRTGHPVEAERWSAAAKKLNDGITRKFGKHGYPRTAAAASQGDSAVTWLGPPFAAPDPKIKDAVRKTAGELTLKNGGILPGGDWGGDPTAAWTPETAGFALSAAASGDTAQADHWLAWLAEHRTVRGSLPEKVDADGRPASVAPLAWTGATVLLALTARDHVLPIPPG